MTMKTRATPTTSDWPELPFAPGDVLAGEWGMPPDWLSAVRSPSVWACPKHGMHRDWMQFKWSGRAGHSNIYCLRCFADTLEKLPGVVVVPGGGPGTGGGGGGTVAPTLTLTVNPLSVGAGGSAVLTWGSQNAVQLVASGGWSGLQALSGTASTGALTAPGTFTLTAVGPGGMITRSVTVAVTPALAAGDVQVMTGTVGGGVIGFDSVSAPAIGSVVPTNLPTGGAATGLAIKAILSGPTDELWVSAAYAAGTTQTNQFDSVHVTDDNGVVRTFLASAATYTVGGSNTSDWVWYGSNPAMATSGKVYIFTFVKA